MRQCVNIFGTVKLRYMFFLTKLVNFIQSIFSLWNNVSNKILAKLPIVLDKPYWKSKNRKLYGLLTLKKKNTFKIYNLHLLKKIVNTIRVTHFISSFFHIIKFLYNGLWHIFKTLKIQFKWFKFSSISNL